jgi:hypothetical protein
MTSYTPMNPNTLKYHERDLVQVVTKYGESKEAAVDNIFCQFIFDKPKDGWVIFYDLKWTGTGHTHGWFLVEEFSPITA